RMEFYRHMDAANVDLKAFTEDFYWRVTNGHLQPVLETLEYLKHETAVWFEITNLVIPGANDSEREFEEMTQWIIEHLGPDVPLHFTAFHPDYRMRDLPHTPHATLIEAHRIATKNGLRYVYVGNVVDVGRASTYCHACGERLIERRQYTLGRWQVGPDGACAACGAPCAGVFAAAPGSWGSRRQPVRLADFA
ncbi:MAG: AmmeMemoRadiSam system radical SAM enzyme, partial [Proteobacteria bacterium]|nr:AmmeMemoRadiSam system radical SAM enzyme [Pseudomonadota bacterium]